MSFDPHIFASEIALGLIPTEDLPLRAQDAMIAGFDGDALVRLAILEKSSGWEVDQVLPRVFAELHIERPDEQAAANLLVKVRVERILSSHEDPLPSIGYFHSLYLKSDYDSALFHLAYADELVYEGSDDEIRVAFREVAEEFLDPVLAARRRSERQKRHDEERQRLLLDWPYVVNSPTGNKVFWKRLREELIDRSAVWKVLVPALLLLWWAVGSLRWVILYFVALVPFIVIMNAIRIRFEMKRECQTRRWRDRIDL